MMRTKTFSIYTSGQTLVFMAIIVVVVVACSSFAHCRTRYKGNGGDSASRAADIMLENQRTSKMAANFASGAMEESSGLFSKDSKSTSKLLREHGLDAIADLLAEFIELFDFGTNFSTRLNDDAQFHVLNKVIASFVQSFSDTLDDARRAPDAPDSLDAQAMDNFFERQRMHVRTILGSDPAVRSSELAPFIGKVEVIFDKLKIWYRIANNNYISLTWPIMGTIDMALRTLVPFEILDRDTFAPVLHLPTLLRETIHEHLELAMNSQYGPVIKMAVNVAANYLAQRAMSKGDEL